MYIYYILTRSHFDVKIFSNQGKQRGRKVNLSIRVQWHIHADQLFVRQSIWTFVAESQRRIDVFQHIVHLGIVDFSTTSIYNNNNKTDTNFLKHISIIMFLRRLLRCIRIIFGPNPHKLVQMMGSQDTRVSSQIIKIIHNNGNEQIQHLYMYAVE